ncbi:MAG TPA: hypothetical protein VJB57_19940 [Dehalococcoidia bacterium]|nr:hypothetical protein [Dehalococcoidia bacterium]
MVNAGPSVAADEKIRAAIARLVPRSDRAEDAQRLVETFVDNGIIGLVEEQRNQVIYGRRGTGKTHVLNVLQSKAADEAKVCVVYLDMRTLGSSSLFDDSERPIHERFMGLYKDVLSTFYNVLFEYAIERATGNVSAALSDLDDIERQLKYSEPGETSVRTRTTEEAESASRRALGGTVGTSGVEVRGDLGGERRTSAAREEERAATHQSKIVFPAVYDAFLAVLEHLEIDRFLILIDEWSSIPLDLQPYLAELLNRVFFANRHVTIKIATLEFRSRFVSFNRDGIKEFGLELGGDIESLDLDDFYVYDRDPAGTEATFADVLYRHVNAALDDPNYLRDRYGVESASDFVTVFFTENAFKELVRAAEGVARDLLQVFGRSYTHSWRNGAARVTGPNVTIAARDWYESDKQANLGDEQHLLLRKLTEGVIGAKRARSFMVAREDSGSPLLRSLIDQRVVHMIRKGYADKDNPGTRYNIYTLDYGCYVDLKGTKVEPQFELPLDDLAATAPEELAVPFDDHRSIRRIIVPRTLLYPDD